MLLKTSHSLKQHELSSDIRTFLIQNISKTGGHFSSNLGIVELTVALHYVFDSPKDRILFDIPLIKAASPTIDIISYFSLFKSLAIAIPIAPEIAVEV